MSRGRERGWGRRRRWSEAREVLAAFEEAMPDNYRAPEMAYRIHVTALEFREAEAALGDGRRNGSYLVGTRLLLRDFEGAARGLARERAELPEEWVTGSVRAEWELDEARIRSEGEDPEGAIRAIDLFRQEQRCPACYGGPRLYYLIDAGRYDDALDGLSAMFDGRDAPPPVAAIPEAYRLVGEVADRLGDTVAALEAYRTFVGLWAGADPELRAQVERVQARIAELEGG